MGSIVDKPSSVSYCKRFVLGSSIFFEINLVRAIFRSFDTVNVFFFFFKKSCRLKSELWLLNGDYYPVHHDLLE